MGISLLPSLLSNAAMGGLVQQASLFAVKKTMDESRIEAAALIQMMEQVPTSASAAQVVDYYA
jgi:hypothetical protein